MTTEPLDDSRGERWDRAHWLRAEGVSLAQIAASLAVSRARVHQILRAPRPTPTKRLPTKRPPYTCPDCGRTMRQAHRRGSHLLGRHDA